jgi:Family of unknown function (DUF5996)
MSELWPELKLEEWQPTYDTLQRWLQIVGKVRLTLSPKQNHWWHSALYLTARGLTTSPIPYQKNNFQIDVDFVDHAVRIETNDGGTEEIELFPRSVADFYREFMNGLHSLGIDPSIWTVPVEVPERTAFELDETHASYDAEYAHRFWRILAQADRLLKEFRSRFIGKISPVHFFWGGLDIAVTRFSGRPAPEHGSIPNVARFVPVEAYSHEVSSCGFWPGAGLGEASFYAYAYPEPEGFSKYSVQPKEAYYHDQFGEFLLPYSAVRKSNSPDEMLLSFLQTTYEAAANRANWDRAALEKRD